MEMLDFVGVISAITYFHLKLHVFVSVDTVIRRMKVWVKKAGGPPMLSTLLFLLICCKEASFAHETIWW
jgi:hypothetical protein